MFARCSTQLHASALHLIIFIFFLIPNSIHSTLWMAVTIYSRIERRARIRPNHVGIIDSVHHPSGTYGVNHTLTILARRREYVVFVRARASRSWLLRAATSSVSSRSDFFGVSEKKRASPKKFRLDLLLTVPSRRGRRAFIPHRWITLHNNAGRPQCIGKRLVRVVCI